VTAESQEQRRAREQRRILFDSVAGLYDATRQGYPADIADAVVANAAIGPAAATVLEIGCGTGQLTRQVAGRALSLTAIDIGAAMVQAARPIWRCLGCVRSAAVAMHSRRSGVSTRSWPAAAATDGEDRAWGQFIIICGAACRPG
jgi:SAM-dependent methyltransferase